MVILPSPIDNDNNNNTSIWHRDHPISIPSIGNMYKSCNYRIKSNYLFGHPCTVRAHRVTNSDLGSTEKEIKKGFSRHLYSFRNKHKFNSTGLSKFL